jgi:hypothetical protein
MAWCSDKKAQGQIYLYLYLYLYLYHTICSNFMEGKMALGRETREIR